jgi:hypothetical protein
LTNIQLEYKINYEEFILQVCLLHIKYQRSNFMINMFLPNMFFSGGGTAAGDFGPVAPAPPAPPDGNAPPEEPPADAAPDSAPDSEVQPPPPDGANPEVNAAPPEEPAPEVQPDPQADPPQVGANPVAPPPDDAAAQPAPEDAPPDDDAHADGLGGAGGPGAPPDDLGAGAPQVPPRVNADPTEADPTEDDPTEDDPTARKEPHEPVPRTLLTFDVSGNNGKIKKFKKVRTAFVILLVAGVITTGLLVGLTLGGKGTAIMLSEGFMHFLPIAMGAQIGVLIGVVSVLALVVVIATASKVNKLKNAHTGPLMPTPGTHITPIVNAEPSEASETEIMST